MSKMPKTVMPGKFTVRMLAVFCAALLCSTPALSAGPSNRNMPPPKDLKQKLAPEKKQKDVAKTDDLLSPDEQAANQKSDPLPNIPLNNDLLYQILSADIAEQRGFEVYAFDTMMDAAKETNDPRLARRAAEIAVKARKAGDALDATRLWHQLAPQSVEAERFFLGFLVVENRLGEVRDVFASRLAKASPAERPALFYQFQQILSGTRDKAAAFSVMEDVLKPYLDMPAAHISLSVSAFINNDSVRAKGEAQKALALKPDSETAVLALAQASSDSNEAIEILSGFLEKYPNAREVRIAVARLMIKQKQYDRAKKEFEKIRLSQPQDLMVLYSLGLLSIQQNDYVTAEKYLAEYLQVASKKDRENRDSAQVLFLLAQIAEEQHDYDKALGWLAMIEKDEEDDVSLSVEIKIAQIYAKKGNIKQARRIISELENENPYEKERLLLTEAQILRDVKKQADALDVLKKGLTEFPKSTNILYDYALTAENLGQYDHMETALRKIIEIDPQYQQAYNALGYSFADRNIRLEEAHALIEKAMKLAPNDPFITDSFGWVLFRQGKIDEAEQQLRQAYQLRSDPEIAVHLGEVLWVKGDKEGALAFFRQAKAKDAKNELLHSTLSRLKIGL